MSFIPNLGSLGPIGKLLDPGGIAKDVVNGMLPKNMGAVGDVIGAIVDFKMGNPIGAAQHAMEAIKDLPQAAKGLQGPAAQASNTNGRPPLEPPPPPLGSRAGKPFDFNELLAAIKALTAALTGQRSSGILGAVPKELREKLAAEAKTETETSTPATAAKPDATTTPASSDAAKSDTAAASEGRYRRGSASLDQDGQLRTATQATSAWVGTPPSPPPTKKSSSTAAASTSAAPAPAPAANPGAASAPPATATPAPAAAAPAATPTPAASIGAGQTITSVSQLQGMTDSAVKDAVMNGRIAPEVAKDQTAMMAIQQRMNAISEMNNLMTAMMRAVHDMQMAIIQNIRI